MADRPHVSFTVSGLAPDAHTVQRLQHASPQHIHATSRRCFIGPIPEAWLSRHRKSWYQYRPHLSTYSSKTATFDASANLSLTRELAGLDSQSLPAPSYSGPSFPQPADIADDEAIVTVEPHSPDVLRPPQTQESRTSSKKAGGKTVSFRDGESRGEGNDDEYYNDDSGQPSTLPSRPRLGPRQKSGGQSSFVTAPETPPRSPTSTRGPASVVHNESSDRAPGSSLDPQVRQSSGSSMDTSLPTPGKTGGMANSTSSLLRYEGIERTSSRVSAPQDGIVFPTESSDDVEVQEAEPDLRELRPIATGLVHFQLPDHAKRDKPRTAKPKRSAFTSLFQSHTKPGELIKAERMLVRVDWTKSEIPSGFNENDSLRVESAAVEKWREFMVVCRRHADTPGEEDDQDDMDETFLLQMSKSRVIPMIDQRRTSGRCAHEIVLHRRMSRINMFSSLDKTIVLWSKWEEGNRIYVLRPRSASSAVEWYTFMNTLLGWKRPQILPIHVPDLNVTLNIDRPFQSLRDQVEEYTSRGELVELQDAAKGTVAHDLVDRSMQLLETSPVSASLHTWLQKGSRIGLAWKRYDRLEWVHGANEAKMFGTMAMQQSHELELRLKQHYPTTVTSGKEKKSTMEEPTAVEGFLVRLTSQRGRHKRFGKSFYKRLYFHTHNQYLCFCQPAKALPPKPPKLVHGTELGQAPKTAELAEKIPLIYAVNPYPLEDGHISWLKGQAIAAKKQMDQLALEETERKVQTLLGAQGYINLCDVQQVRRSSQSSASPEPPEAGPASSPALSETENPVAENTEAVHSTVEDHVFELVLKNGLVVRLQAYDVLACKEWIKCLRKLSTYWKQRTEADISLYKRVRRQNLKALDISEDLEAAVGQSAQKWEVTRAIASAELFNMCGISSCRSITISGSLYYKPRLRAKFRRCNVILCHGKLLIFQDSLREHSGQEIPHIHHERQQVLDLEDTYTYSGTATEDDLLYQNQTFDNNHPGHHALPRVYLEDRWTSSDEDTMTSFVVWHRKSRSVFKASTEQEDGKTTQKLRYVSSLGRPGRAVVFKARSRAERDHWVMSIHLETDRIAQTEDLRLVT